MKKFLIVSLILFLGCAKKVKEDDYIARVEDNYLLKRELIGMDSNFVRSYVEAWINNNLIYMEAVAQGYGSNDKIERMVDEFRKSLIAENFLQNEIMKKVNDVTEEEIRRFYQEHSDEFILDKPIVRVGYVKLNSRNDAIALRRKILRVKNFQSAVEDLSKEAGVLEVIEARYFDQFNAPFAEFWRVAWNLNRGEISFPVKSGEHYFLIYLYDKKNIGDKADLEFIVDVVRERVIVEKRNLLMDSLIANLKRKYHYDVKW